MATTSCSSSSSNGIQFSVRLISGKFLVLHAHPKDTIRSIHEKIHHATGIPLFKQRLTYRGKKPLSLDYTLSSYSITNKSTLHLAARIRSTKHPLIEKLLDEIRAMCEGRKLTFDESTLTTFLNEFPKIVVTHASGSSFYPDNMFVSSCVPEELLVLYDSPHDGNKERALNFIQGFITSCKDNLEKPVYHEICAPIVLQFCKLLRPYKHDDPLYMFCRTTLESMLNGTSIIAVQDIFPFFDGLATELSKSLVSSTGPSSPDVHQFNIFLGFMMNKVVDLDPKNLDTLIPKEYHNHPYWYDSQVGYLYSLYRHLLSRLKECLTKLVNNIKVNLKAKRDDGCDQYLPILKQLHYISQLYEGTEETFWTDLRPNKVALCYLIVIYAKRGDDDYKWILNRKDLTSFETRRHLVTMLLPDVKRRYRDSHTMSINRSSLLTDSIESINGADLDRLRGPISISFKNEEARGPGVLREWFILVCEAIFNPRDTIISALISQNFR